MYVGQVVLKIICSSCFLYYTIDLSQIMSIIIIMIIVNKQYYYLIKDKKQHGGKLIMHNH
jgi:hypothetical protein